MWNAVSEKRWYRSESHPQIKHQLVLELATPRLLPLGECSRKAGKPAFAERSQRLDLPYKIVTLTRTADTPKNAEWQLGTRTIA